MIFHGIGYHVGWVHGVIAMYRTNVLDIVWCFAGPGNISERDCRVKVAPEDVEGCHAVQMCVEPFCKLILRIFHEVDHKK